MRALKRRAKRNLRQRPRWVRRAFRWSLALWMPITEQQLGDVPSIMDAIRADVEAYWRDVAAGLVDPNDWSDLYDEGAA